MSLLNVMRSRCSVRKFVDRAVERETLLQVLEAARIAPSACNLQPWHFIVVVDAALKARIANPWAAKAPAIIVCCGDHQRSWHRKDGKDHCDIDLAIAIDHMTLAAAELGLGTCWICSFDAPGCARALALPGHVEAIALLPIGYPVQPSDPARHAAQRKPLAEIVSWGGWPAAVAP